MSSRDLELAIAGSRMRDECEKELRTLNPHVFWRLSFDSGIEFDRERPWHWWRRRRRILLTVSLKDQTDFPEMSRMIVQRVYEYLARPGHEGYHARIYFKPMPGADKER